MYSFISIYSIISMFNWNILKCGKMKIVYAKQYHFFPFIPYQLINPLFIMYFLIYLFISQL